MKRHQFVPLDMTNRCAACPEVLAHPVHSVTLRQQQLDLRNAWIDLGESLITEGRKIVDWFQRERERLR